MYVRCTQLNSTQLLSLVEKVRDTTRDLEVRLLPMNVLFCKDDKSLKSIPGARTLTCTTGTSNLECDCVSCTAILSVSMHIMSDVVDFFNSDFAISD